MFKSIIRNLPTPPKENRLHNYRPGGVRKTGVQLLLVVLLESSIARALARPPAEGNRQDSRHEENTLEDLCPPGMQGDDNGAVFS